MPDLRVPSVQHLSRNWHAETKRIVKALVDLALNPPRFNYNPLFSAVRDMLVLGVPYEEIVAGIRRIKRERVRNNLLEVLPLIRDHFAGVAPDYYQTIGPRYYPVGRGLMVPFEPPMIYGVGGQRYFPWFSFWRYNPLALERLSLFVTLVDEILLQDPDLETARFEILDFSAPKAGAPRILKVIDTREVARVSNAKKTEMLEILPTLIFKRLPTWRQGEQRSLARKPLNPIRSSPVFSIRPNYSMPHGFARSRASDDRMPLLSAKEAKESLRAGSSRRRCEDVGSDHLLETPQIAVVNAKLLELLNGVHQIFGAGTPMAYGARKNRRDLLHR